MSAPFTTVEQRPIFFENWRAAAQDQKPDFLEGYECPLYSDAWIVGEERVGPYHFINTIAHASGSFRGGVAPVVVLRVGFHLNLENPRMDRTDIGTYHGGTLSDEVAALAALALGARVEAGPTTREFLPGDPRGRPVAHYGYAAPELYSTEHAPKLPWATGRHTLEDLHWLGDWFDANPKDQIALVRAARLYQQAIWVADADTALTWLLLVSAIETAADRWDQARLPAIDRLRYSKPALVEAVEERCPDLLPTIADEFADSIGATRKFVDFTLNFLPPPPDIRPAEEFRIPWNLEQLRRSLRTIYDYRSKALHTGVPFPAPMCELPRKLDPNWGAPCEKPFGLATSTLGGVWLQKDTPMLVHIFEYVTRKVLQKWWSSLRPERHEAS
jgi:hypothetical protein